jgi:HEAT repeat protein
MGKVDKLIKQLGSEDKYVRQEAAQALSRKPHRKALDALIAALQDDHDMVRRFAAGALGEIGDPAAVPALLEQAQNNPDSGSRSTASAALGSILGTAGGGEDALEVLLKMVDDDDATVRAMAAQSLGKLGDRRATPALLKLLTDSQYGVRGRAIEALADIGDPDAVEPLAAYYWQTEGDRRTMAEDAWRDALRAWRDRQDPDELILFLRMDTINEPIIRSIQRALESTRR